MKKGKIIILSGASSVGKKTIRDLLIDNDDLKLIYSISMTTRPQRDDEVDGRDYYFVSHDIFAKAVKDHQFLEFTEFGGYYYGTPKSHVEFLINQGKSVLIEVEAQGAAQIRLKEPSSIAFFVMPESAEELERQIRERYQDDETSIQQRLNKAAVEMELSSLFKYVVKNSEPQVAVDYIKEIVKKRK